MFKNLCRITPTLLKSICNKTAVTQVELITSQLPWTVCSTHGIRFNSQKVVYYEGCPKGWQRIYEGPLKSQIRAVKWFSLTSSLIGIVSQPFLYKEITALGSVSLAVAAYSFVGFFTVVTPVLLHLITKKYVTHIDYNPETGIYSAKTYTFLCMLKQIEFKPEDVKVPDIPGMFTSIVVKDKPIFIELSHFKDTGHYAKIMGYDKPIDFKLYETPPDKDP